MTTSPTSLDQFQVNFTGMFPKWLFTKIAKMVSVQWTKWQPELRLGKSILNFFWTTRGNSRWKVANIHPIENPRWPQWLAFWKSIWSSPPEPKGQLTQNLVEVSERVFWSEIQDGNHFENLFWISSPEPKVHLTGNLVKSIAVTCK